MRKKSGPASKGWILRRPGKAERGGLVLDLILAEIWSTRRVHHLPTPTFGLEQIKQEPGAKSAADRIIKMTLDRHARKIYLKRDLLFDRICVIRRSKQVKTLRSDTRWRIPHVQARNVLREFLQAALQTIVQLPKKDARVPDGKRDLKQLASHCEKLANEMDRVFHRGVVCHQAMVYFSGIYGPGLEQFYQQVKELKRNAETINAIFAKSRSKKQRTDSPNPQVRLALSFLGWIEAATGKRQYGRFKTLLNAAYAANRMDTPPWVERLEIEMTRDRAHWRAWNRFLRAQSAVPVSPKSLQNPIRK